MQPSPPIELPGIARNLIQQGLLTEDDSLRILLEAQQRKRTFIRILIRSSLVPEEQLFACLGRLFMIPMLDLDQIDLVRIPTDLIPFKLMRRHQLLPLRMLRGGVLVVGCTDPSDSFTSQTIQFVCQAKPDLVLIEPSKLQRFLDSIRSTKGLEGMEDESDADDEGKPLQFWDFESGGPKEGQGSAPQGKNDMSLDDLLGEGGLG